MGYFLNRAKAFLQSELTGEQQVPTDRQARQGCEISEISELSPPSEKSVNKPPVVDALPEWHAEEVERYVEEEGVCIFWSNLFGELVAFIKDELFRDHVPCGIVVYTKQEVTELFDSDAGAETLKLIHEAKKQGGKITGHEKGATGG